MMAPLILSSTKKKRQSWPPLTKLSESPQIIRHNAAFHQSRYCLLRLNPSSEEEIQYFQKLLTVTLQYIQWYNGPS